MERNSIQSRAMDGKAALWAGFLAGTVFLLLELLMVPTLGGGTVFGPLRMIAAILLGPSVLAPAAFNIWVLGAALLVHYLLALLYALIFAVFSTRLEAGAALVVGLAGGYLLYLANFYGFTALFPWFAAARNGITVFNHLVFGVATVLFYQAIQRAHRREVRESAPLIHHHA